MFKLAIYLRSDETTLNPFSCSYLRSYIRNNSLVMTIPMIKLIGGLNSLNDLDLKSIILIGETPKDETNELNCNIIYVNDIYECIKYLSTKQTDNSWWYVGDNASCNRLIRNGLIMNVHISKCYDSIGSNEWNKQVSHTIEQSELFYKSKLEENDFEVMSIVRCTLPSTKFVRHYMRQNKEETTLLTAMSNIISNGFVRSNRTGTNTRSLFGQQFEYRMIEKINPETGISSFRLPLLTTKRMFTRGVFTELKWFLSGGTNSKTLESQNVNIWKGNTTKDFLDSRGLSQYHEGETGPIYGFQWKHWGAKYEAGKHNYEGEGIDQVENVIHSLQTDPYSRRHIISAWNASDLDAMCLPPCHVLYQFMVHEENEQKYLSLMMYQRSCDVFLGLPFNICSLGMFLTIMAHRVDMKPYKIIHSVADFHLYETHIDSANKQISREPCCFPYIHISSEKKEKLQDYDFNDIQIEDYYHHSAIKADMIA